jgi:hypothetical protein
MSNARCGFCLLLLAHPIWGRVQHRCDWMGGSVNSVSGVAIPIGRRVHFNRD